LVYATKPWDLPLTAIVPKTRASIPQGIGADELWIREPQACEAHELKWQLQSPDQKALGKHGEGGEAVNENCGCTLSMPVVDPRSKDERALVALARESIRDIADAMRYGDASQD
jgi:hypothetical protein